MYPPSAYIQVDRGVTYYSMKANMTNIEAVDRPRIMYIMPLTLRYAGLSNLGISVAIKHDRQAMARMPI